MIENYIRPAYQKLCVDPIAKRLVDKCTPNQITLFACFLGILIMPALSMHRPLLATLLLLLSGYCDTLDGTLARLNSTNSNAGTMFDIVIDRIVEFAVILGLFAVDPMHRGWETLFMLGSVMICVTSFLVVGIFTPNSSNKGFHYSPGLIERFEAFVFFTAMIWLPHYFQWFSSVFSILVGWTAYLRVSQFVRTTSNVIPTQEKTQQETSN